MKNEKQNPRREFLSTTIKGASFLVDGLAVSPFTQILAAPAFAENKLEFRTKLAMLGTLSLLTRRLAILGSENLSGLGNYSMKYWRMIRSIILQKFIWSFYRQ